MDTDEAAPCRNAGAPEEWLIGKVVALLSERLRADAEFLASHGLTPAEYSAAYGAAIERIRGQMSATDEDKRLFVDAILNAGLANGVFQSVTITEHTKTKVYRIILKSGKRVGLVRKGCPDGNHTTRWDRPSWADEFYLWWLCPSSTAHHPGTSIWKGLSRLKSKLTEEPSNSLDGVLFHDQVCGTPARPCPKQKYSISIDGRSVPMPCIYTMPNPWNEPTERSNWRGEIVLDFPTALLELFQVPEGERVFYTSYVGVKRRGSSPELLVSNRYGIGKTCHVVK